MTDAADETAFIFNVVMTGGTFRYLRYFVCSLMANSRARFRFVGNGCTREALDEMRAVARARPDRVVEVLEVCPEMEAHGVALDEVLRQRDDGDHFCFIDPDIKARGPFLADFAARLRDNAAVTSGQGVWTDDPYVPEGHRGVAGEHFFRRDGFVYGSPHLAMYRRDALDDTLGRWGIQFRNAGPDIPAPAKERLIAGGHDYLLYDTAKVVNILLQADGHRLVHEEHPNLMHIGGMSQYLSPHEATKYVKSRVPGGEDEPAWSRWPGMAWRFEVTRYTAAVLRAASAGEPVPTAPGGLEPSLEERLRYIRDEVVDLVESNAAC
jgi:hypothetical protein